MADPAFIKVRPPDVAPYTGLPITNPCPSGYSLQPGPSGTYRDATDCLMSTALHRDILGISQDATTLEAAKVIAAKEPLAVTGGYIAPSPPAAPVPIPPPQTTGTQPMATSAPIISAAVPQYSLLGDIIGIAAPIIGGALGGPGGAAIGGAIGGAISGGGGTAPTPTSFVPTTGCPSGYIKVGSSCVATNPVAALPGGQPLTTTPSGATITGYGAAVMGRYGAALQPAQVSRFTLRCPPGAVLGKDSLCYNKRDLRRGERKWPHQRPPVTVGDMHAIQRADRARKRLVGLTKKAGAFAAMKKPQATRSSRGVITKAEAARALRA